MMEYSSIEYRLKQRDQLCYIHIPKTAGTTFTSIIDAKFSASEICPALVWSEITRLSREELANYRLLRGHFYYYVHKLLPGKPVYITMMRDPIERVISGYEFMKRCRPSRPEGIPTHEKALLLPLKEYVCDPSVPGVINAQTRHISDNLQRETPDFYDPRWLESAQENLTDFVFIGITERFRDSMALLAYTFGWNPLIEYQNLMVAPKRLRQEDIAPDVIEAIAARNQLDMALYTDAKAIFEARYTQMIEDLLARFNTSCTRDPEPQVIYDLLEQNYARRYQDSPHHRRSHTLTFDFTQAMSGGGWHLQEGLDKGNAFRWTGPGTVSTLDFPLMRREDLVAQFRIINTVAPDVLDNLVVSVNGTPLALTPLYTDTTIAVLQGVIPKRLLRTERPFVRFTFTVNRTVSPQSIDPNNPDTRPVGLAFNLVRFFPVGTLDNDRAVDFLFDSDAWKEVIELLQTHLGADQRLFAPTVFGLKFPDAVPPLNPEAIARSHNYNHQFLTQGPFQWAVIHKGMKGEQGAIIRTLMQRRFVPVFANEVFVVFTNTSALPSLPYMTPHVKSLYVGYLKYYLAQRVKFLSRLVGHGRVFAKHKLWPAYLVNIKPYYVKYVKKPLRS